MHSFISRYFLASYDSLVLVRDHLVKADRQSEANIRQDQIVSSSLSTYFFNGSVLLVLPLLRSNFQNIIFTL